MTDDITVFRKRHDKALHNESDPEHLARVHELEALYRMKHPDNSKFASPKTDGVTKAPPSKADLFPSSDADWVKK